MAKRKKVTRRKKKTLPKKKKTTPEVFQLKKNVRTKSLNVAHVPRVRKELLDYDKDWLNNLKRTNPEDYLWLAQFVDEYVGANVRKDKRTGKVKKGHLHKTTELAKDCYDMNNRRNNDVHSVTKANGLLYDINQVAANNDGWYVNNPELTEDSLIAKIDGEKEESEET